MRCLTKLDEPSILESKKEIWLQEFLDDLTSNTKKYRYRHTDIKSKLKEETGYKCVYCESKIGHNTPGDIEHKIPSSKNRNLHFTWENLTIACTECNRRKNDYYEEGEEFLDPYIDPVEDWLEHHGPLVSWVMNNTRAEITVKTLELNSSSRYELILYKMGLIDDFLNLLERFTSETDTLLKKLHKKNIEAKVSKESEYSAMLISVLNSKGIII